MLSKVKERLDSVSMLYTEKALSHCTQLTLACGVKVNVFNTGTVTVQGSSETKVQIEKLLGLTW